MHNETYTFAAQAYRLYSHKFVWELSTQRDFGTMSLITNKLQSQNNYSTW